jgi:peptidoglycan hydrolase-like protein with peptidoglycan-binding domain
MSKKIVRLTEADLTKLVRRVIKEQNELSGQEVYELQTALNDYFKMKKVGINGKLYQIPVDSRWGDKTINALKTFQKMEKINPDGIPGPDTYKVLHNLGLDQDIIDKAIAWIGKLF